MLQILEDAERAGGLSDLERDMLLSDLREAYAEVRFGVESVAQPAEPAPVSVVPVTPAEESAEAEEEGDEPEVEVELLFDEEEEDEPQEPVIAAAPIAPVPPIEELAPIEDAASPVEEPVVEPTPIVETSAPVIEQPKEQPKEQSKEQPKEQPKSDLSSMVSPKPSSAILSLYEDAPAPVIGEQFHEKPSVADSIACPKGVAESAPVSSLRGAIGVADKFMLVRELFDGDASAYERAIDALEEQASFDDCVIYISENFAWRAQAEGTKFMMELLQRRYGEN